MRSPILRKWLPRLALGLLPIVNGCSPDASNSPKNAATAAGSLQEESSSSEPAAAEDDFASGAAPQSDISEAPFKVLASDQALPATIRHTGPVAGVIKLANAGLDQGVMLAFITNSPSTFNLSSDEIIYLNDLGVASSVVQAMMQRDQALKEAAENLVQTLNTGQAATLIPLTAQTAPPPDALPAPAQPEMAPLPTEPLPPHPDAIVDSSFSDALSPYGNWVAVEGCGPCWQPSVTVLNPGWQPYVAGGRWLYTDCGWYWLSGYSWGWAAFHYGRWFHHHQLGWCWTPESVWSPAWVCWKNADSYAGWAPLPPGVSYTSLGLLFHGRPIPAGFHFGLGADSFVFVAIGHILDHQLHHFALPPDHSNALFHQTTVTTGIAGSQNRIHNNGIPPGQVAAAIHGEVRTVALRELGGLDVGGARAEHLSLGGKTLAVFRPQLSAIPEHSVTMTPRPALRTPELAANLEARSTVRQVAAPAQIEEASLTREVGVESRSEQVVSTIHVGQSQPGGEPPPTPGVRSAEPESGNGLQSAFSRGNASRESQRRPVSMPQTQPLPPWYNQRPNAPVAGAQRQMPWMESPRPTPGAENRPTPAPAPFAEVPRYQAPVRTETPIHNEEPRYSPPPAEHHNREPAPVPPASPPPAPAPQPHAGERSGR